MPFTYILFKLKYYYYSSLIFYGFVERLLRNMSFAVYICHTLLDQFLNNDIRNGEAKLGKEAFKKAYEFLKKMRYGDDGATSTVDENHIMSQLRQITPNVTECFIIDQLLFLEKQADIEKI